MTTAGTISRYFAPILFWAAFPAFTPTLLAQTEGITVFPAKTAIKIDGLIDEADWQNAQIATDFTPQFPVDTGRANARTEVRVCFDRDFVYIAAVCWQKTEDYTVQSLKRDFGPGTSDCINVLFSPFKDGLNGFLFAVSPLNVQREALIDNGANMAFEWDNKWYSAVTREADKWTAEMAIPFKTLRYKVSEGENIWDLQFIRTRLKNWETSTWAPVPRQYSSTSLNYTRPMRWSAPPPRPSTPISLIPYVTTSYARNYPDPKTQQTFGPTRKGDAGVGGDAKIGITPSLNLDLTINPDFSQVEVDRQVANLSRFELFFPERRQFFLENRDLFSMFGFPSTRPFFSRRIGLAYNPVTGQNQRVPILAGGRLSGKLNDNWRVGLLNMQTQKVEFDSANVLPAANFTVATVQVKVHKRSALSVIYTDKENFLNKLGADQREGHQPWNRVAGIEYNLYSADNRWEGETYYHRSFSPDSERRGSSMAQFLGFRERNYGFNIGFMRTDTNYTADMGFVPRPGVMGFFPGASVRFFPKSRFINQFELGGSGDITTGLDFPLFRSDHDLYGYFSASMNDNSVATIGYSSNFTYLFEPFDPSNLPDSPYDPLPVGEYTYNGVSFEYISSPVYNLQGALDAYIGQYFSGKGARIDVELNYRMQPYGTVGIATSYNRIRLPQPFAQTDLWIVSPSVELSLTRALFVSAFFQWNTQANNFNINARLQWRFAPVSDVYLVYTDNSFAAPIEGTDARFLTPKNKAIVLKAVYWLNI